MKTPQKTLSQKPGFPTFRPPDGSFHRFGQLWRTQGASEAVPERKGSRTFGPPNRKKEGSWIWVVKKVRCSEKVRFWWKFPPKENIFYVVFANISPSPKSIFGVIFVKIFAPKILTSILKFH